MLSCLERIYGLSLIWKEAEYNFPFWSRLDGLNWDAAYRDSLETVAAADNLIEYYLILKKLSRFFGMGIRKLFSRQACTGMRQFIPLG